MHKECKNFIDIYLSQLKYLYKVLFLQAELLHNYSFIQSSDFLSEPILGKLHIGPLIVLGYSIFSFKTWDGVGPFF